MQEIAQKRMDKMAESGQFGTKKEIAAKVEDGILTIELPKIQREEGKTSRQIAIS